MTKRPFPIIPRKLRVAAWIAAIGGPILALMACYEYYRDLSLLQNGVRADATINSFRRESTTKGREVYHFDISWRDDASDKRYRKKFSTPSSRWQNGAPVGSTTVIYFPDAPQRSEIGDSFRPDTEPIILGILFAAAGAISIAWLRYSSRRNIQWLDAVLKQ
jgi:hypothetical protein